MIALFKKELRELRPIIWVLLALVVAGYWFVPFVRIDELSIVDLCPSACRPSSSYSFWWGEFDLVLLVAIIYVLFVHEREAGTIDFLNTLPLSNGRIFATKVMVALAVFFSYQLLPLLISLGLLQISLQFRQHGWQDLFITQHTLLLLLYWFVLISHAVLFSYFRSLGIVIYLVLTAVTFVVANVFPEYDWLRVSSLLFAKESGVKLVVHWEAITYQSIGAVLALLLGFYLWRQAGKFKVASLIGSRRRQLIWPVAATAMVLVVVIIVEEIKLSSKHGGDFTMLTSTERVQSNHYTFVYADDMDKKLKFVTEHADRDFQALSQLLDADIPGTRISVDATSRLRSTGVAGVATGRRVGIDVLNGDTDRLRRVLNHETVHVYQYTESAGKFSNFPELTFFIEGMAEYYSFLVAPNSEEKTWSIRSGSVLASRYDIQLEDLIDGENFEKKFGLLPLYPLGQIWTDALTEICGERIAVKILRAVSSQRKIRLESGEQWWRQLLQTVGCDYDSAKRLWQEKIIENQSESDADYFPQMTLDEVKVTKRGLNVKFAVEPERSGKTPVNYFLAYRNSAFSFAPQKRILGQRMMIKQSDNRDRIVFKLPVVGDTVYYQVGFLTKGSNIQYSQPYRRLVK